MKFKPSIYSICALLALLTASCTREPLPEPAEQEGDIVTITATIPEETRVFYNDNALKLTWEQNDTLLLAGYDAGGTYIASSKFGYTGTGNQFLGTKVPGATTYKAYYPGNVITLGDNGQVQLPDNFWQQTQDGNHPWNHIGRMLFISDTEANAINQTFNLTLQSSICKIELKEIPPTAGTLTKLIWTVETVKGGKPRSTILDLVNISAHPIFGGNIIFYLVFDPNVMKIAQDGKVIITLVGAKSYEWSTYTTKIGGMTYVAGKRYNATINGGYTELTNPRFRYSIQTNQPGQLHKIWQITSASSPATLTINWGDGKPDTIISEGTSLTETVASHIYDNAGNYTITITSDEIDPTKKQMPQITFYKNNLPIEQLTDILDPFLNMKAQYFDQCFESCPQLETVPADLFKYNSGATSFTYCFQNCLQLEYIPTDLFIYNTQATNFTGCFSRCTKLASIPSELFRYNTEAAYFNSCFDHCSGLTGTIPAELFKYNTKAERFYNCFRNCSGLTSIPNDLFRYNTQTTTFRGCFADCTGLTSIPNDLFRYNTQVTNFSSCFLRCSGLTSIPADLFWHNTQATNFSWCFSQCTKLQLRADIFPDPDTNSNFFAGRTMNFQACFYYVGTEAATAGTAPKLWGFNGGGRGTTWTITDCFTGANVVNRNVIPKSWGGDLADLGNVTNVDGEDW